MAGKRPRSDSDRSEPTRSQEWATREAMMNPCMRHLTGRWTSGPNAGQAGIAADVRAGMLYTEESHGGGTLAGRPEDFLSEAGESGDALLNAIMPWPEWRNLFHGAVRESLAAAHSVAKFGIQDTHAWDQPQGYVVDDNQGSAGLIQFSEDGLAAAVAGHEFVRDFDCPGTVSAAPPEFKSALLELCDLPLLKSEPGISAVFWSSGTHISGPEPWHRIYRFGGELFRRELLPDSAWATEGAPHYDLTPELTQLVLAISKRAAIGTRTELSEQEMKRLVPPDSECRDDAVDYLLSGGRFRMT